MQSIFLKIISILFCLSTALYGPRAAASTLQKGHTASAPTSSPTLQISPPFTQTSTQTYLKNWGLSNPQSGSHIQAPEAWKIEEGKKNIIVAVIDTGIDATHPDLSLNLWHSSTPTDFEEYGWNFVLNRPNPTDDNGHGTHVAGIIGAMTNIKTGVSGVAHHISIMPIKYYSDVNSGPTNLKNTVKAIYYAIQHGAHIINYSGGGPEFSEEEYLAIKKAESKGILIVAAAGNEHQDTDQAGQAYFPSGYQRYHVSNIISVAATNIHNQLLTSSNYGKKSVDVAAPGEHIYSTLPHGNYGYMSGTSQATAFVSGLAALLLSQNSLLTPTELKEMIMTSTDPIPALANKIASGGRINAYKALLTLRSKNYTRSQFAQSTKTQNSIQNNQDHSNSKTN